MVSLLIQYITVGSHLGWILRRSFLEEIRSPFINKEISEEVGVIRRTSKSAEKLAVSKGRGIMHNIGAMK
jgi:hypothetical protein